MSRTKIEDYKVAFELFECFDHQDLSNVGSAQNLLWDRPKPKVVKPAQSAFMRNSRELGGISTNHKVETSRTAVLRSSDKLGIKIMDERFLMMQPETAEFLNPPRLIFDSLMQANTVDYLLVWADTHDPETRRREMPFYIGGDGRKVRFGDVLHNFPGSYNIKNEAVGLTGKFQHDI